MSMDMVLIDQTPYAMTNNGKSSRPVAAIVDEFALLTAAERRGRRGKQLRQELQHTQRIGSIRHFLSKQTSSTSL